VLVGLSVSLADIPIHFYLVIPMESIGYFVALFVFAFLISAVFYGISLVVGSLVGAAVFTLVKSMWYYVGYLTYNPAISRCVLPPTYNCTIKGISTVIYFHFGGYPVQPVTIFEGLVHFALFLVFFLVWSLILGD
jgi:hypothetical protein